MVNVQNGDEFDDRLNWGVDPNAMPSDYTAAMARFLLAYVRGLDYTGDESPSHEVDSQKCNLTDMSCRVDKETESAGAVTPNRLLTATQP